MPTEPERPNWRAVIESYPCDTCGAEPGEPCRTISGTKANPPHVARTRPANRCHKCGTMLAADAEPGTLCPKHALLRSLEIERATHYRRRTP